MTKLLPIEENGQIVGYFFDCPGCQAGHALYVRPHRNIVGAGWDFNGDMGRPTFRPSVLSRYTFANQPDQVCHSFVTDGQIQFLNDCMHSLAGLTVDIPDL